MRMLRTLIPTAAAVAALLLGTGAAQADPPAGILPAATDTVAVSSEDNELLGNQFSVDYNATNPASKFYSWDALGSSPIQTKNNVNCDMPRPSNTSHGIAQLQAKASFAANGSSHYCVDMVLSARDITPADGTGLASVHVARDLITWATNTGGDGVVNLTDAELQAIYSCNAAYLPVGDVQHSGAVRWSDLRLEGGISTDMIVPVLPWASSDEQVQWLADIGVTVPGTCVLGTPASGLAVDEDEGTNAVFTQAYWAKTTDPNGFKDLVFPFSAGSYVCQVYTLRCSSQVGKLGLGRIDGIAPVLPTHTINVSTPFPARYIDGKYVVVLNAGTPSAPMVPANLVRLLGRGDTTGWICGQSAAADMFGYGFAPVPYPNCGHLHGD